MITIGGDQKHFGSAGICDTSKQLQLSAPLTGQLKMRTYILYILYVYHMQYNYVFVNCTALCGLYLSNRWHYWKMFNTFSVCHYW